MKPTYTNYFSSNRMSECPILRLDLLDTSNNALSNPSITIQSSMDANNAKLRVVDDAAFSTSIKVKGYTLSRNELYTLNVRVCGAETISTVS
jgi:hypothetical protein